MTSNAIILNVDGIPSKDNRGDRKPWFHFDPQSGWRRGDDEGRDAVETVCVRLHDDLKRTIFRGVANYQALTYALPSFVGMAGHNSEAPISRDQFEHLLSKVTNFPEINRFLYLYDCQKLISSVQEAAKEIIQIEGEFYFTFNTESFFYPPMKQADGVRYSTSPIVTKLFAYLTFIFIRMHSLLDYTVKIAIESERLQTDFKSCPRMSSLSEQYGSRKRVSFNGAAGTLLEDCEFLTMVETLRNHLIHDGLLDDMPKAYELIAGGEVIEKFVLMPDMNGGRFDRFKNRNLFFGKENKINGWLPDFINEFLARMEKTLELVRQAIL